MIFARSALFFILGLISCSASDEKKNYCWQRTIPYIEINNQEEAIFIVDFFATYKGKKIRESRRYFKENDQDTYSFGFGTGTGDGPGGQWRSQALNIYTRNNGIHIDFHDSAGKGGETHRKIQKAFLVPWDQVLQKSEEGEYAFKIQVTWKK